MYKFFIVLMQQHIQKLHSYFYVVFNICDILFEVNFINLFLICFAYFYSVSSYRYMINMSAIVECHDLIYLKLCCKVYVHQLTEIPFQPLCP